MKALIFNSGLGSRLGELTANRPKGLIELGNGETIFSRQLRILRNCGVNEFIVTTGPFPEQIMEAAALYEADGSIFSFVPNPVYDQTNYIYSMHLADSLIRNDTIIVIHGDLVFDEEYARKAIEAPYASIGSVNPALGLPAKDFKARIDDGLIAEVSVDIFDEGCVAFQPFYKLDAEAMGLWLDRVARFCTRGERDVYAENAANEVFEEMKVKAFSYEGHIVEEVDTPQDLTRVSDMIRFYDASHS